MPMEAYTRLNLLGAGTFGKVYRATVNATGETVAIKKLHSRGERDGDREGMELSTLREIMLLAEIKHEHVIDLMEVFSHNGSVHMVLEICATDLEEVIKDAKKYVLDAARIKGYMLGTLRGLAWCHKSWVLHRDLKPANLFLTPGGVVKLGDFGLARFYGSPDRKYTGQVVTRWYRPPELLFGAKFYGAAVDMWSVGCIFAELMLRVPFFHGKSDIEQLSRIFTARGTPTEETWPGVSALPTTSPSRRTGTRARRLHRCDAAGARPARGDAHAQPRRAHHRAGRPRAPILCVRPPRGALCRPGAAAAAALISVGCSFQE